MKFKFFISADKIPRNSNFMFVSLLKKTIELGDKTLFNELYFWNSKKNKKIKPFCFSIFLNNFKMEEKIIETIGGVELTVSTPDYNLGIAIYNGALKLKEFKYKEFKISIDRVVLLKEKEVKSGFIPCKTLSPIYIRDRDNNPIAIEDENFEKELNYISNKFLEVYRGYGLNKYLKFINVAMRKKVVKEEIEGFKENTNKDIMYVNCYHGLFNLEGDIEDLNVLLKSGLGFRRSEGYGLFEII